MATDYSEFNALKRQSVEGNGAADTANTQYPANAVLDDQELQAGLNGINPRFGEFCIRVAGEAWGLPLVDQKTKALISIVKT